MTRQRYAKLNGYDVYLMDRATKATARKGYIVVQSLKTGYIVTVKKDKLKNITYKYPKKIKK